MTDRPVCITPKPDDYDAVVTDAVVAAPETLVIYSAPGDHWDATPQAERKPDHVPPWVRKGRK